VMGRVALQINCKLGGAIWSLTRTKAEEVVFVAIDVAHDPFDKSDKNDRHVIFVR